MRLPLLLLIASAASALSPKLSIRQYAHTAWTESAGEPLPALHTFAQARDGYLYLIANSSYLRFDGLRFTPWTASRGHRLPSPPIYAVTPARDGALWLAGVSGLTRVQAGRVTDYPFPWSRAGINGIFEDRSGVIWTAVETDTENFIQSLSPDDGSVRRFGVAEGAPQHIHAMAGDGAAFWLGIDDAVCRWMPGAPAACQSVPGAIEALAPAGPGVAYAASATAIFRIAAGRAETIVASLDSAINVRRHMLLVDRHGNLWVGATGGLLRVQNGKVERLGRKDGLSGEFVIGMLEDAEGDIWIATNNGIDRFRDPRVIHLSTLDGLSGEFVTAVRAARDGSVWVGALGNGLNRIQDGRVSRYSTAEGLPGNTITALEEDSSGRLWVACGDRFACFRNGRFAQLPFTTAKQQVYALASDARGRLWAAANSLWRISGQSGEAVAASQPGDIFRVFASSSGQLWLGSLTAGVMSLSASETAVSERIPSPNGASPRAILEDRSGALWFAAGPTLNRVRSGKVTSWGSAQGLAAGEIYGVTADHRDSLWLATDRAVVHVALDDLDKSPDGEPRAARFASYDAKDGLRLPERGGMPSPRITTAADGRIWVCERDGVGILDPDVIHENTLPPPVVIEGLAADGVALSDPEPRFRGRQLQITYTANSLTAPERVRFRYRLDGGDPRWTQADGRREVTFVDLPPSNYRFHVTACNLDGVCNEAGATADFVVLPFYYQTVWFKFLVSAAAWSVIWGVYKLRMRQIVSRYQLVAQDRARVTREIHDSLLQGFAGVVLQLDAASRQFHSNPAASKERLDRALNQADESLREARQMLLDLRLPILEGRTLCEALAEVGETTTRGTPIAFSLKIRGNERPIPYPAQVALYLIGREAIRNAVNHANPSRITAAVSFEDRDCRLRVQDDGCGFDLEAARRKSGRLGVQGMGERAREARATFRIETAPGAGTTVEVVVPYKSARPPDPM